VNKNYISAINPINNYDFKYGVDDIKAAKMNLRMKKWK